YRGLLMTGRYAVAFLFLDLPPDHVDVNIHPTKAEVRFLNGQALYHLVLATVRERLRAEDLTARLRPATTSRGTQPAPSYPREEVAHRQGSIEQPAADPGRPAAPFQQGADGALAKHFGVAPGPSMLPGL